MCAYAAVNFFIIAHVSPTKKVEKIIDDSLAYLSHVL